LFEKISKSFRMIDLRQSETAKYLFCMLTQRTQPIEQVPNATLDGETWLMLGRNPAKANLNRFNSRFPSPDYSPSLRITRVRNPEIKFYDWLSRNDEQIFDDFWRY
jgi:hypothetical protein